MKKLEIKITNITPKELQCIAAACPTIFKTNKGTCIVVGKKLNKEELTEEVKNKIGEGEMGVEIPQGLLARQ